MAIDPVSVALGGWVFSVITAVIAYKAATKNYRETTRDGDKSVYVTAVTNERAKWREELRSSVCAFTKECAKATPDLPEMMRLKTDIILRLNPRAREPAMAAKHKYDAQIMNAVNRIYAFKEGNADADVSVQLALLELGSQELLKQEWEKSKTEAVAGRGRFPTAPAGDA